MASMKPDPKISKKEAFERFNSPILASLSRLSKGEQEARILEIEKFAANIAVPAKDAKRSKRARTHRK